MLFLRFIFWLDNLPLTPRNFLAILGVYVGWIALWTTISRWAF